jgi:hypothetical protein
MAEQTFIERTDIKVTSARVIFGDHTYALTGVTSVRGVKKKPSRKWPIIIIVGGALTLGPPMAIITTLIGIIWWLMQKTEFVVMFSSAAGDSKAYTSRDGNLVTEIVAAINEAIVYRSEMS